VVPVAPADGGGEAFVVNRPSDGPSCTGPLLPLLRVECPPLRALAEKGGGYDETAALTD